MPYVYENSPVRVLASGAAPDRVLLEEQEDEGRRLRRGGGVGKRNPMRRNDT